MSSSYFFKLDENSKNGDKEPLGSFYLSGSSMLHSEILLSKGVSTHSDDYYKVITHDKFDLIEKEIKVKVNILYQSLFKEIGVVFMAKLDGLNQESFDKSQKHFINKLFPLFKDDVNTIIDKIVKLGEDNEKLYFNIVLLNSLLVELDSERVLEENGELSYKEYDIYEEFIIKNPKLIKEIDKNIDELVLEKKENSLKLLSQIVFLQDIFLKYPNTYIDKESISESLLYYYDEIISLLRLLLFVRVGNITKTDIVYG